MTAATLIAAARPRSGRFPALVAGVIEDRRQTRALAALLVASLAANVLGASGWRCPIRAALGVPCPGCGLSRGAIELLSGHLSTALAWHPLAPVALAAAILLVVAALLPAPALRRLAVAVRHLEESAPLDPLVVTALLAVWALRLAFPTLLPPPLPF